MIRQIGESSDVLDQILGREDLWCFLQIRGIVKCFRLRGRDKSDRKACSLITKLAVSSVDYEAWHDEKPSRTINATDVKLTVRVLIAYVIELYGYRVAL